MVPRRRLLRASGTLVVTGLCVAYIVWKVDAGEPVHVVANGGLAYFFASVPIMGGSIGPIAWRWQQLLRARGVHERFAWLVRAYFVGYTASQILPTSFGGDASRIYETARRNPGSGGAAA